MVNTFKDFCYNMAKHWLWKGRSPDRVMCFAIWDEEVDADGNVSSHVEISGLRIRDGEEHKIADFIKRHCNNRSMTQTRGKGPEVFQKPTEEPRDGGAVEW
jgi:hypothetical protein